MVRYKPVPWFQLPREEREKLITEDMKAIKQAKKDKAAAVIANLAKQDKRSEFEDSTKPVNKEKAADKLTIPADISKNVPGTTARKKFEKDFKTKLIFIESIQSTTSAAFRQRTDSRVLYFGAKGKRKRTYNIFEGSD